MRRNMWRVGLFVVTLLACSPVPVSAQFQLELFSNNGTSTLASGISSGATSLTVASGHGARFPSPTGGQYMWITLEESGTVEILKCTARATDTISGCTRAQQSTSASAFTTAANVYLAPTAGTMANIRALTALPFVVTSATAELSAEVTTLPAANGGSGATTLTGLLQGNGTSAFTGITNSSTVGQILRVTGASTYAWGALNLADTDAVTGVLPAVNFATGTPTGSKFLRDDQVWTVIAGGGDALVANPLSQFAATTSAQLRGVMSDESGSGALIFAGGALGIATVTDEVFDATVWNGSLRVPSQNAIRDYLETFVSVADPAGHRLFGWDDTDNAFQPFVIGAGLTYTQATDTLTADWAATKTLTNTTYNTESTGNVFQDRVLYDWTAGVSQAGTASGGLNLPTSNPCSATDSGQQTAPFATCDFDAATDEFASWNWKLASWYTATGGVDIIVDWFANASSTNAARFCVNTTGKAVGNAMGSYTFNDETCVDAANNATANNLNQTTFTGVDVDDWVASGIAFLLFSRDANHANDNLSVDARVMRVQVIQRVSK